MRFPQIYSLQLLAVRAWSFLDTQVSLAPAHVSPSVHWLVGHTFDFLCKVCSNPTCARHSRLRIDGMLQFGGWHGERLGGEQGGRHGGWHGGQPKIIFFVLGGHVVAHGRRQGGRHGGRHRGRQKNILADMEFDMVADKEVAKLADMMAGHGG